MLNETYAKEKEILITGRPVEDESAPTYKKVYVNAEIINAWIWHLEYVKGFNSLIEFGLEVKTRPSTDISKYYKSETEFNLIDCAKNMGYDIQYSSLRYFGFTTAINGKNYILNFGQDENEQQYINIYEYPIGTDSELIAGFDFPSENKNVKVIGKEESSREDLFMSKVAISRFVWLLETIKESNNIESIKKITNIKNEW